MAASPRIDPAIAAEIDRLATAVAKDPRSKDFLPLADEYIKAGMWQEAAAVLEDGLKAYPGFVTAMAALGRVYDQLGQPAKAKSILEDVVKQRPDNLRAHRILAKLYQSEGHTEQALSSCMAILNANPFDEEALSLKRTITGAPIDAPPARREKKRLGVESTSEKLRIESPAAVGSDSIRPSTPATNAAAATPVSASVPEPSTMKHAATIARLEAWLGTIQSKRHPESGPR
ncbi:tetratricopeptide repeat protein [Nitrospira defluvii]|uniref:TPR_REGION domain-containing protein n=1 Tax=Nitrospira defluvii TaxID=330214 RepID=A0ABN7LYC1_9BACT|nr:tetratricopeptide repeat protein [Nitrospira defluvii]CAE6773959.1 TPR_REGION domain-containing protein [Nitrospira defluvii]